MIEQENQGASAEPTGLGSAEAPEPHSGLRPTGAIPCANCERLREALTKAERCLTSTLQMFADGKTNETALGCIAFSTRFVLGEIAALSEQEGK